MLSDEVVGVKRGAKAKMSSVIRIVVLFLLPSGRDSVDFYPTI